MFYKATEKVANLFDDDSTIVSKAKFEAKHGKGPKIITPKQVLQRLTIALALVKAGKTPIKWNQTNHMFFISSKTNY